MGFVGGSRYSRSTSKGEREPPLASRWVISGTVPSGGESMPTQSLADHLTRHTIHLPFHYRRAEDREYRAERGWTRDLSGRGAWVELPETFAPSSQLDLNLHTRGGSLRLAGQVAWVRTEPDAAPYLHGVLFTSTTSEQRDQLRTLIARAESLGAGRLYCTLAATYRREGVAGAAAPCETRNLSRSGVALRLPERLSLGTHLRVSIPTAFGRITADAQVVWAEQHAPHPRGAPYRHGLRFLRLEPSSELPLRVLLHGVR